jgi:ATHILA ORF-1 family
MNQERRSKRNQDRTQAALRAPTPPPDQTPSSESSHSSHSSHSTPSAVRSPTPSGEPEPARYDSEVSDHHSGHHTDRAEEHEANLFLIPTRRMFERLQILELRNFKNTPTLDFDSLRTFGIEDDFRHLTGRIGFTPEFWGIEHNAYKNLTLEFLSSLQLKYDVEDRPFIKFRMCSQTCYAPLADLRSWFGFPANPITTVLHFREGMDKERFWNLITGLQGCHNKDYKGLNIPHPVLRCIQRALACTIFARGETVHRANETDLRLLDHMLRPDAELERPDLMLFMVEHWLEVAKSTRTGGDITLGGYVTHIAQRLEYQIVGDTLCRGPTSLDTESFRLAKFVHLEKGAAGHQNRYYWCMPDGTRDHRLPFSAPLFFEDRST